MCMPKNAESSPVPAQYLTVLCCLTVPQVNMHVQAACDGCAHMYVCDLSLYDYDIENYFKTFVAYFTRSFDLYLTISHTVYGKKM